MKIALTVLFQSTSIRYIRIIRRYSEAWSFCIRSEDPFESFRSTETLANQPGKPKCLLLTTRRSKACVWKPGIICSLEAISKDVAGVVLKVKPNKITVGPNFLGVIDWPVPKLWGPRPTDIHQLNNISALNINRTPFHNSVSHIGRINSWILLDRSFGRYAAHTYQNAALSP